MTTWEVWRPSEKIVPPLIKHPSAATDTLAVKPCTLAVKSTAYNWYGGEEDQYAFWFDCFCPEMVHHSNWFTLSIN